MLCALHSWRVADSILSRGVSPTPLGIFYVPNQLFATVVHRRTRETIRTKPLMMTYLGSFIEN